MHNTVWGGFVLPSDARVVIHTFGSDFDTVLAAYRGTTIPTLVRVASNDNRIVPGVSATHSLIQFDAVKNVPYSVQFGSKTEGDTGDVFANFFAFPPSGGLSIFPTEVNGVQLGDFVCGYHDPFLSACSSAKFIVHNSTYQTLIVTATHDLGAGVTAPSQVTLTPGALATMQFQFTGSFDQTTVRTLVGHFAFAGRVGSAVFATAQRRAIVIVKPTGSPPTAIAASIVPQVRAGGLNEEIPFDVRVKNTGSQPAIGCLVHRQPFGGPTRATWQLYNPATGAFIGAQDAPATIPPGQTYAFSVSAGSHESRIADPTFVGTNQPFAIDCANTNAAPISLANSFDITVRGGYDPAPVNAARLAPAGGVLDVPAAGAAFRVQAVNLGTAATLIARPSYVRPFAESDPNKQFTVKVCRTSAAGACTTADLDSIEFSAAKNVVNYFKVIVRPPTVNPGYAPGLRRVFLIFAQVQPIGFVYSVPVAAQSIAVRKP